MCGCAVLCCVCTPCICVFVYVACWLSMNAYLEVLESGQRHAEKQCSPLSEGKCSLHWRSTEHRRRVSPRASHPPGDTSSLHSTGTRMRQNAVVCRPGCLGSGVWCCPSITLNICGVWLCTKITEIPTHLSGPYKLQRKGAGECVEGRPGAL